MNEIPVKVLGAAALLSAVVGIGCNAPAEVPAADYLARLEAWKLDRDEALRHEDGWLTLVGLSWLQPGVNVLGSDPTSDVLFPPGTAELLGEIQLVDGRVELEAEEGSGITHEGAAVRSLSLRTDAEEDPTLLQIGSLTFYVIVRGDRYGVRIKDSEAAALSEFAGMEYFPIDTRWRVNATFTPYDEPRNMKVPNVIGTAFEEPVPGVLEFEINGASVQLTPVGEAGEELFIVFGDTTNGSETYGGGRFLYADPPGPDGRVELDFNRAYNPPCVFTPYATCPLPPPENKLAVAVRAGERSFGLAH